MDWLVIYTELAQFLFMEGKTSPQSFHQNLSSPGSMAGIQHKNKTILLIKKKIENHCFTL